MVILTLNCGSSSAKYQVYDWDNKEVMANGVVERIGIDGSCITHKAKGKKTEIESPCPTHKEAIELIMKEITDPEVGVISDMSIIGAVGHRVLHGGDKFTKSVIITPEVLETFRSVQDLKLLRRFFQTYLTVLLWIQPGTRQCLITHLCMQFHANGTQNMLQESTASMEHLSFILQSVLQFFLEKNQNIQM